MGSRNILLVEPRYPTKFPPLGLMKLSTYHKALGDRVHFVKGPDKDVPYEYWDRIYITSLFTYHWKITLEDILYYKNMLHGDTSRIYIGGIMASLMPDELWKETGICPMIGILDKPGLLDGDNDLVVDDMIPDYDLFDKITHRYSLLDSYFGYLTRGCVNKCKFCGVPIIEPNFRDYAGIKPWVKLINDTYGQKHNLVLFDNNIIASKVFTEIIEDIRELGFERGAKLNNRLRHVDFNQGTDARLLKEWHFKLLSKISIDPLRIAFDHVRQTRIYSASIRLAAKYGIHNLSNYILYNYDDTPQELWQRLKLNIDFNRQLGVQIYSFPMKYVPLDAKDRTHIFEPHWNWQFIRGVQRILNVTKGIVMPGEEFFYRAFGESEETFLRILHMPERMLMSRGRVPGEEERDWVSKFDNLTNGEKAELLTILCENRTKKNLVGTIRRNRNGQLKHILDYYLTEPEADNKLTIFDE
ncbi:MAG TPA: hypothetical protein PLU95_06485 [Syntrophales bacterium]|nr:hypothetical protein [Syntrophales bacterium]HPL68171.1 hypothetical protein [Smithellaceae bacterium]HPN08931.1 hypothetical protein [Syntrophales bacterium]HPX80597.1 hypothetical protein [Syntrophales bacterium]